MSEAIDYFSARPKDKCCHLMEEYERSLAWEEDTVSLESQGRVEDDEQIARQIHSPHSYDKETKKLTTDAFENISNSGFSVNRLSIDSVESLLELGIRRFNSNPKQEYIGIAIASVGEVRNSNEGKERWFAVYDTANRRNKSHAEVCAIYPKIGVANRTGIIKRQRELLREVFSTIIEA